MHEDTSQVAVVDWGRTRYVEAWRRQNDCVTQRIAGEVGDLLVFTEHEAVFTMGLRAGADAHLLWNEEERSRESVELVRSNRGGDITYHGPGQIVGYPILSLQKRRDLHAYLRSLEQLLIESVAFFGLEATRREGKTGIWIGQRKVAAIGVAVKRWVAYHGFALNVNTNLRHFAGIVPCGIRATDGTVTSMQAELGHDVPLDEVKRVIARQFQQTWGDFIAEAAPTTQTG